MHIRILLAEDHGLVRAGIRALLEKLPDIDVVAEASNGIDTLQLIDTLQPDVVLLDIGMQGLNGLEVVASATGRYPQLKVIMLSMHTNEEYVWQALRSGASGYLVKDAGTSELAVAVRAVVRGEIYLSPAVSKYVVAGYIQHTGSETEPDDGITPRQREILKLIAEGAATKEIAQRLGISVKTVETHRTQLMERLKIYDVAGLVRYAIRLGLISADL